MSDSSPSIKDMHHHIAESIMFHLPVETVCDSVLMASLFPLADLKLIKNKRLDPRPMLSNISDNPGELLETMLATSTILCGEHIVNFFYPGFCKKPRTWNFLCSDNNIKRAYFTKYMLSKCTKTDPGQLSDVLGCDNPDCKAMRLRDRGYNIEFSFCTQPYLERVLQQPYTWSQCFVSGYGCISLQSHLSKLYLGFEWDSNSSSSDVLDEYHHSYVVEYAKVYARSPPTHSRGERSVGDSKSFVISHAGRQYMCKDADEESRLVYNSLLGLPWNEAEYEIIVPRLELQLNGLVVRICRDTDFEITKYSSRIMLTACVLNRLYEIILISWTENGEEIPVTPELLSSSIEANDEDCFQLCDFESKADRLKDYLSLPGWERIGSFEEDDYINVLVSHTSKMDLMKILAKFYSQHAM